MKKKHFYTAVILLLLLAVGSQPSFAAVHTLVDESGTHNTYFGTWSGNTFTFDSSPGIGDSIEIKNQPLGGTSFIIDGAGHTINLGTLESGVYLDNILKVTIMNLNVTNCGEGINLNHSGTINVINCTVSDCEYGVWMALAGTCTIEGNIISGNNTGIWITNGCVNNFLYNNTIKDNNFGIYVTGTPAPKDPHYYDNDIYNNNFINSASAHALEVESATDADVFYDNYWDDWSGSGPYVFVGGQDNSPLIDPLPLTPEAMIQILITDVENLNAKEGIINSLDAKLQNALDALNAANAGQRQDALNKMEAFINAVLAQSGNQISEDDAALLIAQAEAIIAQL